MNFLYRTYVKRIYNAAQEVEILLKIIIMEIDIITVTKEIITST